MEYFSQVSILGVPLLFVVIGLVEYVKRLGVEGKPLLGVSMAIGLILGTGYQVAALGLPLDYATWFYVIVYGLGLGVVASGVYDAAKALIEKAIGK